MVFGDYATDSQAAAKLPKSQSVRVFLCAPFAESSVSHASGQTLTPGDMARQGCPHSREKGYRQGFDPESAASKLSAGAIA